MKGDEKMKLDKMEKRATVCQMWRSAASYIINIVYNINKFDNTKKLIYILISKCSLLTII